MNNLRIIWLCHAIAILFIFDSGLRLLILLLRGNIV